MTPTPRRLISISLGVAMAVGLAVGTADPDHDAHDPSPCGHAETLVLPGSPVACVHADEAPAGIDPTRPVSTAELKARPGAGPAAYAAAEALGVASPVNVASTAASPTVNCDGDGTSGFRVQAMYVVEAGKTNRYSTMLPSFQLWAAGTDDVINRTAAVSGGVRHIRYVTQTQGDGTCVATVLNVTVPAGATASFNATISAVQALGYTDPARKYLMWTDATSQCGIATMYPNDTSAQSNLNNGFYAQYARIDSGCWGLGDGTYEHSVEAHELTHTLGGVQDSAPHSTHAGHCWDEADTMCYADGGTHAMVAVCPPAREYLLDCNSDDYFTTFADPGSYLDGHWNAANSQFLIGGGNGTSGGVAGSPTVLGATIGVNNPAVPGLATQVSVTPVLPTGRTLTSVTWTSPRTDCVFSTPTLVQSDVTCAATATTATSVTVKLVDSTGATKTLTSPLTFQTGTARPVTLDLSVDGQTAATASVCTAAPAPFVASATDTATGQPIKGLTVALTSKTATQAAPIGAGTVVTGITGAGTVAKATSVTTTWAIKTTASTVYAAAAGPSRQAVPAKCSPTLTASTASPTSIYYGTPVTVTGTLTRVVGTATLPVSGASLPISQIKSGTTTATVLGTAKTAADGSFSIAVKPTATGTVRASLAASTSYTATSVDVTAMTVLLPDTQLTAAVNATDVGYGTPVAVTGSLRRIAGSSDTPLAGSAVAVKVTPPGKPAVVAATGKTAADGTFSVSVPLKVSGSMSVSYAGVTGQPAVTYALGSVTAGTWTPTVALTASASSVTAGSPVTLTANVTRTYQTTTGVAAAVPVRFYFVASTAGALPVLLGAVSTTAAGVAVKTVNPKVSGTYLAKVTGVAGYAEAVSPSRAITVS